jgi:5-methylcytosine-specific restriction endonuclease McrA
MTDVPQIITRAEAKARGLKRYFTGKPCKHLHVVERLVSSGGCLVCAARLLADWRRTRVAHIKAYAAASYAKRSVDPEYQERNRQKATAWYAANTERGKANVRAYRVINQEKCAAVSRRWASENPDRCRAARQAWEKAHPDKVRLNTRIQVNRRRMAEGYYSAADIRRIYADQTCRCAICKCSIEQGYQIDHIQPISRGGSHWPRNLQLLCAPCNVRKQAKDPLTHMQSLGFLL